MLHVDISASLAKAITPSFGVPDQELTALRTSAKRYVGDWLRERQETRAHAWANILYDREVADLTKTIASKKHTRRIHTILWIGIGGSAFGPKVLKEVFEEPETIEFIVLDSIDPSRLKNILAYIDWKETLIVIASKSGGTLEPMSIFFFFWHHLKAARGEKAKEHVIAVTDPAQGELHRFAVEHEIDLLPVHPDIGGRFSIFTPIGLLPIALLSKDTDAFIRGAQEMDSLCQENSLDENPAMQLACIQFLLDTKRGYLLRYVMPYSSRLRSLAHWDQQLIAESLGKSEVKSPFPVAAMGTQDQHSLLQEWMQGPRKFWIIFIRESEKPEVRLPDTLPEAFSAVAGRSFGDLVDACYEGTASALTEAKRPHVTISLTRVDEFHLGQLFFCFLAEVLFLGRLYRINPYGQPGVERGKVITNEILS